MGPGGTAPCIRRMGPNLDMDAKATNGAKADRTRPVFPYPLTAKYVGTGSIEEELRGWRFETGAS